MHMQLGFVVPTIRNATIARQPSHLPGQLVSIAAGVQPLHVPIQSWGSELHEGDAPSKVVPLDPSEDLSEQLLRQLHYRTCAGHSLG